MSWRDRLLEASFRKIPFKIEDSNDQGGRRVQVHEFPFRDSAAVDDLGIKNRRFEIQGYVLGEDYFPDRDALIQALNQEGPGDLVHPYRGALSVVCSGWTVQERTDDGGMARFSMTFDLAGPEPRPAERPSTGFFVDSAAEELTLDGEQGFSLVFAVVGFAQFVRASAQAVVDRALDAMQGIRDSVTEQLEKIEEFQRDLNKLRSDVQDLVNAPLNLANRFTLLAKTLRRSLDFRSLFDRWSGVMGFGGDLPPVTGGTPNTDQQAANQLGMVNMLRHLAAAEAGAALREVDFASLDEAMAARDAYSQAIEDMLDTAPDELFGSLQELRGAVVRHLNARAADLARVAVVTLPDQLPALVLAHRLYEDPDRDQEIVDLNHVRHPGFLPAGTPLKVLSDATE